MSRQKPEGKKPASMRGPDNMRGTPASGGISERPFSSETPHPEKTARASLHAAVDGVHPGQRRRWTDARGNAPHGRRRRPAPAGRLQCRRCRQPAVAPLGVAGGRVRRPVRTRPPHGHLEPGPGTRHRDRRLLDSGRPDDAGDPHRGRVDQRRRASHVLLSGAGDRARAGAVRCARACQRGAQRHRGGSRAAGRTSGRHVALRGEQGDPLLRRCRCDGLVLYPPGGVPLESAATRGGFGLDVGGRPAPLCRSPAAGPALDGGLPGRSPGHGGRDPGAAGDQGMGGRGERVRALPGGRRGGDSGREPMGKPVGPPFRERPDPDRRRARLGCRLPGHGGGRAAGNWPALPSPWSVWRSAQGPSSPSRSASGSPLPISWDGSAAPGVASSGALPRLVHWWPGAWPPSWDSGSHWCSPGRCSVRWGCCSPGRFSTASRWATSRPPSTSRVPRIIKTASTPVIFDATTQCKLRPTHAASPARTTNSVVDPGNVPLRPAGPGWTQAPTQGAAHWIVAGTMQSQVLNRSRRYLNCVRGWPPSHHSVRKVGGLHGCDECSRRRVRQA